MNKNALTKRDTRKVITQTGKLPDNVGFPRGMQGVTRKLTKRESEQQRKLQLSNERF
jgi:hypothetical protein